MSARPLRTAAQSAQSAIQYFAGKDAAAEEERVRGKRKIQCYDISSDSEDAAPEDEDHTESEADYSSDSEEEGDGRGTDDQDDEESDGLEDEEPAEEAVDPVSDEEDNLDNLASELGSSAVALGKPNVKDALSNLPLEIRYRILSYLDHDPYAILCMKHVSRQWYNTLNHGPGAEHLWFMRCRAVEPTRQLRAKGCKTWRESYIRIMKKHCMRCLKPTIAVFGTVWPEGPDWAVACVDCQWLSPYYHCIIDVDAITLGASREALNRLPHKLRYRKGWHKEYLYRSALGHLPSRQIMQRKRTRRIKRGAAPHRDGVTHKSKFQRKAQRRMAKEARKKQKQEASREKQAQARAVRQASERKHLEKLCSANTSPYYAIAQAYKGSRDLVLSAVNCANRLESSKLFFLANQVHKHGAIATSDYAAAFVEHFIDILAVKMEIERRLHSFPNKKKRHAQSILLRKPNLPNASIHTWLDYLAMGDIDYQTYLDEVDGCRTPSLPQILNVLGPHLALRDGAKSYTPVSSRKCFAMACPNKSCRRHCPGCIMARRSSYARKPIFALDHRLATSGHPDFVRMASPYCRSHIV